jgi:hypothetical protein
VVFSNEVCSTFTAMSSLTLLSDHVFRYLLRATCVFRMDGLRKQCIRCEVCFRLMKIEPDTQETAINPFGGDAAGMVISILPWEHSVKYFEGYVCLSTGSTDQNVQKF